jgi:crotonobetainyl-CoA:carnitine CoA-transferase CaiB-like acyl-CoA transferase
MRLGEIANPQPADMPKPLSGIRILALEQMQALPYATQMLARLGAEVVKIEPPAGESARGAQPAVNDPWGRPVGATFQRNNFSKRSVTVNLKSPEGRDLVLDLIGHFDVVCENFKAGTLKRLGLAYDDVAARHPKVIYASVSGFGNGDSPYAGWPAYASIVEAMSGVYHYQQPPDRPPVVSPVGALGDIGGALYATIGILAALRHRDLTGEGQYVDIAMLDAAVAMTDIVTNLTSMGEPRRRFPQAMILDPFKASDGWFVMQIAREHQFAMLAEMIGHAEWLGDERLSTRVGWGTHLDDVIRPDIEGWAKSRTKMQVTEELMAAGIPAAPVFDSHEVIADPHVASRNMIIEVERADGGSPVLVPGNPVKLSKMADGPEQRVPWVGEHTAEVLKEDLGLSDDDLAVLVKAGAITLGPEPA